MGAALALGERGRGRTWPNPNVGCVLVRDGRVVGRGWTQPNGRPHAEAMALAEAGEKSRGATCYVTLEPCAVPGRGPACAPSLIAAGVTRVVVATGDPFPRVDGAGIAALHEAGVEVVVGVRGDEARRQMAGFLTRLARGRPHVTLKLATSLDGAIALASGESRWITGPEARAHVHLERSRHEAILVGRGTWEADRPALDVRLDGLEERAPLRVVLSTRAVTPANAGAHGWERRIDRGRAVSMGPGVRRDDDGVVRIGDANSVADLPADHLLVEGGAGTAAAFVAGDLVDRLLLYRAPILIGGGKPCLGDIGLASLADAHGRWALVDERRLGADRLEEYERRRCSPA